MAQCTFDEHSLPQLLPLYYSRLFPKEVLQQWLCYGDHKNFDKREICFTLHGDIYLRYQAFASLEQFAQALRKRFPIKIDIGAVYKNSLNGNFVGVKKPIEREIVFDIDLTDYDEIRTCCSGADVCVKCWKFMIIACKILHAALTEDFGFRHILWVFSGRRGIHCWVADKNARKMNDTVRSSVAEYLAVIRSGIRNRKVRLPSNIHPLVQRSLTIIDEYFESVILDEQDILGANERVAVFLSQIDEEIRLPCEESMSKFHTSKERWNAFESTINKLSKEQKIPPSLKNIIEELKLYYAYPRLDINVTKAMGHLLKGPFCVHPKTGKISVPFKVETIDNFDIANVPTITLVLDELNGYDTKPQEPEHTVTSNIKEYKKTSLFKYVNVFNEFLRGLKTAAAEERQEQSDGVPIEF